MKNKIFDFIQNNNLIKEKSKILIGFSGGPDSVFLLYILKELQNKINFEIIAAHLDHEWRKDSNLDVEFCKKTTRDLNIPFFYATASELNLNLKFNGSKEELGRAMRRSFFEKIAQEQNANYIALAHHLNDQEETFLIRLIRGASLSGLVSMKPKIGNYIRPLLEIKKSDILKYLEDHKISYLTDPSNLSPEFLRNRIRNNVIPQLQECDARFDDNFLRTLNKLKETENFLEKLTEQKFSEVTNKLQDKFELNTKQFLLLDKFLQMRILFQWLYKSKVKFALTENFLHEILRFLKQQDAGTHKIHNQWIIEKKRNSATIKSLQ